MVKFWIILMFIKNAGWPSKPPLSYICYLSTFQIQLAHFAKINAIQAVVVLVASERWEVRGVWGCQVWRDIKDSLLLLSSTSTSTSILPGLMIAIIDLCWRDRAAPAVAAAAWRAAAVSPGNRGSHCTPLHCTPLHCSALLCSPHHLQQLTTPTNTEANILYSNSFTIQFLLYIYHWSHTQWSWKLEETLNILQTLPCWVNQIDNNVKGLQSWRNQVVCRFRSWYLQPQLVQGLHLDFTNLRGHSDSVDIRLVGRKLGWQGFQTSQVEVLWQVRRGFIRRTSWQGPTRYHLYKVTSRYHLIPTFRKNCCPPHLLWLNPTFFWAPLKWFLVPDQQVQIVVFYFHARSALTQLLSINMVGCSLQYHGPVSPVWFPPNL